MIRIQDRAGVRWVTLAAPEKRNAITRRGWQELAEAFESCRNARAVVVSGGEGNFCSGADLGDLSADLSSPADRLAAMAAPNAAALALHQLPVPSIAAVDGVAAGAGVNLALGCDVVLVSPQARFAELFVKRGLAVDFGGTWLLPRAVGLQRAKELAFTGRMVDAKEAVQIGLALRIADDLEGQAQALAEEMADAAPLALRLTKQNLDQAFERSFEESLQAEALAQAECAGSEDALEGLRAFLERRAARFSGR